MVPNIPNSQRRWLRILEEFIDTDNVFNADLLLTRDVKVLLFVVQALQTNLKFDKTLLFLVFHMALRNTVQVIVVNRFGEVLKG